MYIFAMPGTPLRRAVFAKSKELAAGKIDRSIWTLESIIRLEEFGVTYLDRYNYREVPVLN